MRKSNRTSADLKWDLNPAVMRSDSEARLRNAPLINNKSLEVLLSAGVSLVPKRIERVLRRCRLRSHPPRSLAVVCRVTRNVTPSALCAPAIRIYTGALQGGVCRQRIRMLGAAV